MKKEEIVNRIGALFDQGLDKLHDVTDDMEGRFRSGTKAVTERTRNGWTEGRKAILTTEARIVETVKQHPTVFILAGASVLGLILAKLLYDTRRRA